MLIKFSLVDHDERCRQKLRLGLESISGFTCIGSYASGKEALAAIPRAPGDVVLMAIRLPGIHGIECTHRLRTVLPKLPILMLTGCRDHTSICEALIAGASGYLIKPLGPRNCEKAIREVMKGSTPLCMEASKAVLLAFRGAHTTGPGDDLTSRENGLVACLFQADQDKDIARKLGIGLATVHTHLHRLFAKLKVKTRAEEESPEFKLISTIYEEDARIIFSWPQHVGKQVATQ